jgi:hypothetical protein
MGEQICERLLAKTQKLLSCSQNREICSSTVHEHLYEMGKVLLSLT